MTRRDLYMGFAVVIAVMAVTVGVFWLKFAFGVMP